MTIARIEDLHCDAGWRTFSFLKITTDDGIRGGTPAGRFPDRIEGWNRARRGASGFTCWAWPEGGTRFRCTISKSSAAWVANP
jgi:hypothetical protein